MSASKKERGPRVPHHRSIKSRQRREVLKCILSSAFVDRERSETICVTDEETLIRRLSAQFPYVNMDVVEEFECGEVLVDSRGTGSLQF